MSGRSTHPGVVVGVDGSPSSRLAVRWAAREATMRNIPLTLVNVVQTPARAHRRWHGRPPRFPLTSPAGRKKGRAKMIADAIKVAEDSVQDGNRPEIDSELVCAAPVPSLVDLSKQAHMMVVGCRGQDALQRTLLGSVSTGLVHHAHCPVAVIHDEARSRCTLTVAGVGRH